ncbi:MAG TPA: hypothetical protein VFK34_05735 [Marmoricola sp.]|jgi:hypothetical protein|nr:hypothetical protein [Marmoricola sp.]
MSHLADDDRYAEQEEGHGTGDTTAPFRERPDDETIEEIEAERRQRLDPANRPPNAEVDNTHRHFNPETGHFDD